MPPRKRTTTTTAYDYPHNIKTPTEKVQYLEREMTRLFDQQRGDQERSKHQYGELKDAELSIKNLVVKLAMRVDEVHDLTKKIRGLTLDLGLARDETADYKGQLDSLERGKANALEAWRAENGKTSTLLDALAHLGEGLSRGMKG